MSDNRPPAAADEPTGPRLCEETCQTETFTATDLSRRSSAPGQRDWWLHRFEYHPPLGDQVERYGRIRAAGRAMVELLIDLTPDCLERDRALEALQQSIMLANAAIACNESPAA